MLQCRAWLGETNLCHLKTGEKIQVEMSCFGIDCSGTGKSKVIAMVIRDITEHILASESLRASEHRVRLATEATGVGIWDWNVETNSLRWDDQMFHIYGITPTPKGLINLDEWAALLVPEDLPQHEAIFQDTIQRLDHCTREFRIRRRSDRGGAHHSVGGNRTHGHGTMREMDGGNEHGHHRA